MQEGISTNYKDIIKAEYLKCASDPVHFLKKYVYIQTTKGRVLFQPYLFQEKLLKILSKKDRVAILKSRQLGITTLAAGYALWLMIFKKDVSILALAPTQEKARNIVDKVRFAYEELPSWLKIEAEEHNKLSLILVNGSKIRAASGDSNSARGYTANVFILDEAAFINNAEDLWASAQPVLSTGGQAIVLSTPNGRDGFFYNLWSKSEMNENNFIPVKLRWDVHPDRDPKWREDQDKELGKRLAAQECFEGDTRVYTSKGPKRIKDISVGDEVLTHKGRFRKVVKTMSHESDDLYEIKSSSHCISRTVTKNHPFLHKGHWDELSNINSGELLPSFFDSSLLQNRDVFIDLSTVIQPPYFKLVVEENVVYVNDRKHKTRFPRHIKLDYEIGHLVGLYLSEGSKSSNRITLSFDYKKELNDWPASISDIIFRRFGITGIVRKKKGNSGDIDFSSQILSLLVEKLVVKGDCYSKCLSDFSYENMNKEYARGIVDGAFKGDGCLLNQYRKSLSTTSEDLFYDIQYLLKSLGVKGVTTVFSKGGKEYLFEGRETSYKTADKFTIYIGNSKGLDCEDRNISSIFDKRLSPKKTKEVSESGFVLNALQKIELLDRRQVYNLEVEEDHTYVTEHFIVHNCDCNFLTSGDTYFESEDLEYYQERAIDPIEMRGPQKDLWIWNYPEPGKSYMAIVDTAKGDGSDSSTIQVLEVYSGEQVAEYKGGMETKTLAKTAIAVCLEYNDALLIVENTGLGHATMSDVLDLGYNNIYYSPKGDTLNVNQYVTQFYEYDTSKMTPGFTTSTKTRPEVLLAMRSYVGQRLVNIKSVRTVNEMFTFVWKNGKPQAQNGSNDDLVIPYAIGLYLRDSAIHYRSQGIDMQRSILNSIGRRNSQLSNNAGGYRNNVSDPYKMNVNGQMEDISWLIR